MCHECVSCQRDSQSAWEPSCASLTEAAPLQAHLYVLGDADRAGSLSEALCQPPDRPRVPFHLCIWAEVVGIGKGHQRKGGARGRGLGAGLRGESPSVSDLTSRVAFSLP